MGTAMSVCAACGAENPARAKFCNECGAQLAAPHAAADERKMVTTLFCDLVGFTAMSEAADPEDVDALLREYSARARRVIESHGGTVEKFIGDAVVGVFGVPAVHEDDPERAVRAALRLIEALEGMARPDGSPLEARCGVNTGEALVRLDVAPGSGDGFLTGDAVNTAARLQAAGPPGGVAVGALTHQLTHRAIVYQDLPPVAAKGKAEPVPAWLATAPMARMGADAERRQLTPLVGRAAETAALRALVDSVIAARSSRSVLIVGEPGIGKTRLVQELFAHVDALPEMVTWRQGRCPSYGESIAFWALAEIVKAHAGILDGDDGAAAADKISAAVLDGPDHTWMVNRLRALVGLEAPPAEREENFTAWLRFFEQVANDEPFVLVVEDLHWADDGLLAFVEHLARHAGAAPLLLLGTARPELLETNPTLGANGGGLTRMSLGPLTSAETEQLVADVLGDGEAESRQIADIVARCAGNPFFAEESARLLADQRPGEPVPASVQAVIAARLDALPGEEKTALADAAVVGEVFWDGALTELGRRERVEVDAALGALHDKHLVRRARESSMAGESEFTFTHALTRDVAYGTLPRRARAQKHAQTAAWLEGRAGGRLEDVADLLAHHSATAFELAEAVGDGELAQRCRKPAVTALRLAGDRAVRLDVEAAERLLARAAGICSDEDPQRPALYEEWGRSLLLRSRYEDARVALEESTRGFLASGRRPEAAMAMISLEVAQFFLGGRDWRAVLDEAMLLTDDEPCGQTRAHVLTAIASGRIVLGDYTGGLDWIKRAVDIYGRCGLEVPLRLQGWQAQAECGLGDRGAGDRLLSVARAMREEGLGRDAMVAYSNYGISMYPIEGPRAYDSAQEGLDFLRGRGISEEGILAMNRCSGLVSAGRWDEARRSMEESRPWLQQQDNQLAFCFWWVNRAELLTLTGEGREAVECAREADERAQQWDDVIRVHGRATLVTALACAGDRRRAIELLAGIASVPHPRGFQGYEELIPQLMRLALHCREAALAEQLIAGIEPDVPLLEHVLVTGQTLLAEARGEHEAAAAGFADAAARWHEFGVPYEEGHALLGQGRCLAALGRAPEAAAPLAAAREIFARLGAKPALAEADEWLTHT